MEMESEEQKLAKKIEYKKTAKHLIIAGIIFSFIALLAIAGYLVTHDAGTGQWPQISPVPEKKIVKIEISEDRKAVLDAATKGVIFTIDEANEYLKKSGYAYQPMVVPPQIDDSDTSRNTGAKYAGDCFSDANLANNKDRIVFSSGCLAGDLPQAWTGIYNINWGSDPNTNCANANCLGVPKFKFLLGGSGKDFVWSADDRTITYEAELGLSGMTETRTIDSATGEIIERKLESKINTADWLPYDSTEKAESYYGRYKIKYPRELFYGMEGPTFFRDKSNKTKFDVEVLAEMSGEPVYDPQNYFVSNVKIGNNNFQEVMDNKTGDLSYVYKTGYSDKNHHGNFYIIFKLFDLNSKNILISSLSTLRFLGNVEKEAIIGADEGSWQKVFKSEKYGFQLKAQNGFNIIDKLDDNMSMVFVYGYNNIYLSLAHLSGVSTVEEWLDREMTINEYAAKKSEREYYRIGDSDVVGIMVNQKDSNGKPTNRVFYVSRGGYLYSIAAPITGINEFAFARMVANFRFLEPKAKLIGLKSKWGLNNIFEFSAGSGKLERVLNGKEFLEKGYEEKDITWYETKIAGIVPAEIKSFFPVLEINPQGSMNTGDWLVYWDKNTALELLHPRAWKLESYSTSNNLYFNVQKEKENPALPRVTIIIDKKPVPTETLSIVGSVSIVKFNGIEALATTMYGEKGETDPYSYASSANAYFLEFHAGSHDYFIEYHFNGGSYNLQEFNTFLSSIKIK